MLQICQVKVRSLDVDYAELSWQISNTAEDVLDYTIQIQRSESAGGPWDDLSVPFVDQYLFYDRRTMPFNNQRTMFYQFLVRNIRTGQTEIFGPYNAQPEADLIVRETRRHMELLFREFAGRRCWVLPRRTFGQYCPSCWSTTLGKRTRSGCLTCFDTGFNRGYMAPIEVWSQVDPGGNQVVQRTNLGAIQPLNTTSRLVYSGTLSPLGILVEAENIRWRFTQINQTEHGRSPIHYEVQMHAIPASDIEYRIPLDLGEKLKDMWISPSRNFTNPHNMENFKGDETFDILSLYSGTSFDPNR